MMADEEEYQPIQGNNVSPTTKYDAIERQPSNSTVASRHTPRGAYHTGRKFVRTLSIASDIPPPDVKEGKTPMTRNQKFTLITFCFANFCIGAFYSLMAPFFPQEAAKKGASSTITGLIFGVLELVFVIMTPVWGNFLTQIGAKYMYVTGILVAGSCNIMFGFLDMCPSGTLYIVMCFLVRTMEGMGASACSTASFAILAFTFPKKVSTMFGTLELFAGLGMMVGPPLGGALYQLGGFRLPFVSTGALILVVGFLSWVLLPTFTDVGSSSKKSILSLLRIGFVDMIGFVLMVGSAGIGFLDVSLALFLEDQFNFTPVIVGVIFLVGPTAYALSAPAWGWIGDKRPYFSPPLVVLGYLAAAASFVFLGPAPFFQMPQTELWLLIVCLAVSGVGVGALVVCFQILTNTVRDSGYPDNLETYGLVSGVFNSYFSCGAFIGPLVGGYLNDTLGFQWAAFTIGMAVAFAASMLGLYLVISRCCCKDEIRVRALPEETSKLLEDDSETHSSYS